jgi:tricarballylate dehydrogenase
MHDAPQDVLVDSYPEEEYWQDLLRVTEGNTNEALARLVIRTSSQCRDWMRQHGVNFQPPLSGALHVARTNAFFMGGGKALINAYYRSAEQMGVKIRYNTPVQALELDNGEFVAALAGEEGSSPKPASSPPADLNLTASGCVKHGDRTSAVNGQPITFSSAAPASTRACCSSL